MEDELINKLLEYQNTIEHEKLTFKKDIDRTVYFEIDCFVRMLEDRRDEQ